MTAAAAAWVWYTLYPMPPSTISITTAAIDGAYYAHALRYVDIFAAHGITLKVQTSAGSPQNLTRLQQADAPADLAFIQGGFGYLGERAASMSRSQVETLANVDVEPLWIFTRLKGLTSLTQLSGLRVAVGPEGSGSRRMVFKLLQQARLAPDNVALSPLTGTPAAEAIGKGALDVVIMVAAPQAVSVQKMLDVPKIDLVSLHLTAAITERNSYIESRLVARSALSANLPPGDITVLTSSASLVARQGLHPALKRLAVAVAMQAHSGGGLLYRAGEFPSLRQIDFPTAPQARATLANGLYPLERIMPFWWAQLSERLLLIVLPITALGVWLLYLVPAYLRWRLESQVKRWYGELKFIEIDLQREALSGLDQARISARLGKIEVALMAFTCPAELINKCYTLRQHIHFVQGQMTGIRGR